MVCIKKNEFDQLNEKCILQTKIPWLYMNEKLYLLVPETHWLKHCTALTYMFK